MILIYLLVLLKVVSGFINCPSNGLQICSNSTASVNISSSTVISNCVFVNCPSIQVVTAGINVTLSNVTVTNSVAAGNTPFLLLNNGTFLSINNCSATNIYILVNDVAPYSSTLSLQNCAFKAGRIVLYGQGHVVNVVGSTFTASSGYPVLYAQVSSATFSINYCTFSNNYVDNNGAVVLLQGSASVSLNNSLFSGNYVTGSGGILYCIGLLQNSLFISMFNSSFVSNQAVMKGGIAYIEQGTLSMTQCTFTSNIANIGGVAYISGSSVSKAMATSCSFLNNTALSDCGTLAALDGSSFTILSSSFIGNSVVQGGGASLYISNNVHGISSVIRNSYFSNEVVSGDGGSLSISGGSMLIDNSIFTRCSSANGGAINMATTDSSSTFTISNTLFSYNTAGYGGAINNDGYRLSMINVTGFNSQAREGGFFYQYKSTTSIVNSQFYQSTALKYGGCIRSLKTGGALTIRNSKFMDSVSTYGGFIFIEHNVLTIDNCYFNGSVGYSNMGWVYLGTPTSTSITNCLVTNTIQTALYIQFGASGASNGLTNVTFINSQSNANSAIFYSYQSTFFFTNCTAIDSYASQSAIANADSSYLRYFGCKFIRSKALSSSGVFYLSISTQVAATSTFEQCTFIDSSGQSGGVLLAIGVIANFKNCFFGNSSAFSGGVFYLEGKASVTCLNCDFESSRAVSLGQVFYLTGASKATCTNCLISTDPAMGLTRSVFYVSSSSAIYIDGLVLQGGALVSSDGTFVNLVKNSFASFNNLQISGAVAKSSEASIFKVTRACELSITNSQIMDSDASSVFSVTQASYLNLQATQITYSAQRNVSVMNENVISLDGSSLLTLVGGSLISNFQGSKAVISVLGGSSFSCQSSNISSNTINQGAVLLISSAMDSTACIFSDNISEEQLDPCIIGQYVSNGGAISAFSSDVELYPGTCIQNNQADYGAGIYSYGPNATLFIGATVQITNNTAWIQGGSIWCEETDIQMSNMSLVITGNTAKGFPASSLAYLSTATTLITDGSFGNDSTVSGNMYVEDSLVAYDLISSGVAKIMPVVWKGKASRLGVDGYSNGSTLILQQTQSYLPDMTVIAYDPFGNIAVVDVSNPLAISISLQGNDSSMATVLTGETVKILGDEKSGSVIFSGVAISNKSPGITRKLVLGSDQLESTFDIDVVYTECDSSTQILYNGSKCVPLLNGSSNILIVFLIIISVILAILFVASIYGLYHHRANKIVQSNSMPMLATSVVGCLFAILSPPFLNVSCVTAIVLENIGFSILFSSLTLKLYRIQMIFSNDLNMVFQRDRLKFLTDAYLFRYILASVMTMIVYIVLWFIFDIPKSQQIYVGSLNSVVVKNCPLTSPFYLILNIIKLLFLVTLSYMSFKCRDIPTDFNESRVLGFACYNWLVFGSILPLLSQYLIDSPVIAILVYCLGTYVSNGFVVSALIFFKLFGIIRQQLSIASSSANTPNKGTTGGSANTASHVDGLTNFMVDLKNNSNDNNNNNTPKNDRSVKSKSPSSKGTENQNSEVRNSQLQAIDTK